MSNSQSLFASLACILFFVCMPSYSVSSEIVFSEEVSVILANLLGNNAIRIIGKLRPEEVLGIDNMSSCEISGKDNATISVSNDGKVLYRFSRGGNRPISGVGIEKAISEEEAFDRLAPILEFYGLSVEKGAYMLELRNIRGRTSEDLSEFVWSIEKELSYNTIPCRRKKLICEIFAGTGEIMRIFYNPVIPPKNNSTPQITTEIAKAIATEWANSHLEITGLHTVKRMNDSINFVIAPQENKFADISDRRPLNTFYCWEVIFEQYHHVHEVSRDIMVWINAEDGTLAGAWNRPKNVQEDQ